MEQVQPNSIQSLAFDPGKLRAVRIAKFGERSQGRVARELLGISPQRLNRYEKGYDNPTPTLLAQICKLYEVELLDLTTENVERLAA